MYFDEKALGNKNTWDKSPIRLLQSPAIMASGISRMFLPENPNELVGVRSKLLLQGKQAGNNSNIIMEQIIAIADKLLEYKSISTKQHSTSVELFSVWNNTDFCYINV